MKPERLPFMVWFVGILLISLSLQAIIHFGVYRLYIDDAYIFMRYAENFKSGNGLVFNVGEKVMGFSSAAYTLLLSLFGEIIPLSLPAVTFILAVFCWCCASIGLARTATVQRRTAWCLFAFWCLYQPFLDSAVNGMETMLFAASTVLLINAVASESYDLAAFLAVVIPFVRPEGAALSGATFLTVLWQSRSLSWWRGFALGAVLAAVWLAYATVSYGSPVPQSMIAKSPATTIGASGGALNIIAAMSIAAPTELINNLPRAVKLTCLVLGAASVLFAGFQAVVLLRRRSATAVIPLGFVFICLFFVLGRPAAIWSWYTIIPCLLLSWSVALALDGWVSGLDRRSFTSIGSGAVVLLLFTAVLGAKLRNSRLDAFGRPNLALAEFIKTRIPGAGLYMCSDIGIPAYTLKINVFDLAGLVSKQALEKNSSGDLLSYAALIEKKKPDVVALRADIFSNEGYPEAFVYRRSFSADPSEASREAAYITQNYRVVRDADPHFPLVLVSKSL